MDITKAIQPKSDQLNSDDLAQPVTVTITDVRQGNAEQPVHIVTDVYGDRRPWKPAKTMLRLMASQWGVETTAWHGKRVTIYRDPSVTFGGDTVGGIRIAAMSGINRAFTDTVTIKRGKRSKVTVDKLPDVAPQQQHDLADRAAKAIAAFDALGTTQADLEQHIGRPVNEWTPDDLQALMGLYAQKNTPAVDTTTGEVIEEQA